MNQNPSVKDHLERGTLDLSKLRFRVLDECDEMLNMGFVDDVEKILNAGLAAKDGGWTGGWGANGGGCGRHGKDPERGAGGKGR
jgi:hypothetical protein